MPDSVRWLIVVALALVLIGLIAYARGAEHHHGDEAQGHQEQQPRQVLRVVDS